MPNIANLKGIKINIYNGDHRPPHLHAVYNEYEALITIENAQVYAGELPSKQMKLVIYWLSDNYEWVLDVFYELNPKLK
jgi:hypothetical protein